MNAQNDDWVNLYEIKFNTTRKQIGNCRYSPNGQLTTELKSLVIMKYKDSNDIYLLYEFVNGVNDSLLETVEDAMQLAEEEFGVKREDWKKLT